MASGGDREGPARADRIRETFAKNRRMRERLIEGELERYREELDSVSEVTLGKEGLKAKGPPWLQLVIVLATLAAFIVWLLLRR